VARLLTSFDMYKKLGVGRSVVTAREAIRRWRVRHAAEGNEEYAEPMTTNDTPIQAIVNHGRWMILCECRNGVNVPPRNTPNHEAVCPACGTIWTQVVFPPEAAEIESALAERKFRHTQSWMPGETPDQLRQETASKGGR